MGVLKNMKDSYNQMFKLDNLQSAICDVQAMIKNEDITNQTNILFDTISKEIERVSNDFKRDEALLKYATFHKLVNGEKLVFEVADRLMWFTGLNLKNIKTGEITIVKWDKFFEEYIPLCELM